MTLCRLWLICSSGTQRRWQLQTVWREKHLAAVCQVAASGFDLGPVLLETWWSVKSTGRHFRRKKLGSKGKWGPGEINICEVYSRKGKAIGSKEIPQGNFLQQQQIRNRTGLNRKLIFPAGVFPTNLRSIWEWQTNAKQMPNHEIITEFTVTETVRGWGWGQEEREREGRVGGVRRGRDKIQ